MNKGVWMVLLCWVLGGERLLGQQPEAGAQQPWDAHRFRGLLERLDSSEPEAEEAKAELRQAGTNVLRLLIEQVRARGESEQRGSSGGVSDQALRLAFEVLGHEAKPLLPDLLGEFRARRALSVTAYALARIGGPEARAALLEGLSHSNTTVRACAAEALGDLRPDARTARLLVRPLLTALQDPSPTVRLRSVMALRRLAVAPEEVIPALLRVAQQDPHPTVQVAAVKGIPDFGVLSRTTKAELKQIAASHPEDLVRKVAQEILGEGGPGRTASKLGGAGPVPKGPGSVAGEQNERRDAGPPARLDAGRFGLLLQRLNSPFTRGKQREEAAAELRRAGPSVLPLLMQQVRVYAEMEPRSLEDPVGTSEHRLRLWAAFDALGQQAQPLLPELLTEFRARRGLGVTAYALARLGGPEAGAALVEALGDSNATVRATAALSLCDLRDDAGAAGAAVKPLLGLLQDESFMVRASAARALGHLGRAPEEVIPALLQLAHDDPDLRVQIEAVQALGKLAVLSPSAKAELQRIAASHKEELVRRAARRALDKIAGGDAVR